MQDDASVSCLNSIADDPKQQVSAVGSCEEVVGRPRWIRVKAGNA